MQSLITWGWRVKSGTALTMAKIFSTVSMRSSVPTADFMFASKFSPHSFAVPSALFGPTPASNSRLPARREGR